MKKTMLTLCLASTALISEAQWNTNLNNGTDLKLGTMNAASLDFYTGGVNLMNLGTDGTLKLRSYTGTGSSPLYVNSDGSLARAPGMGAPNAPCITGAFPWAMGGNSYPADNTIGTCTNQDFILKANTVQSVFLKISGNVGIGVNNSNPQAMLDISNCTYTNTNNEHMKIYGDLNGSIESTTQMNLYYKAGSQFVIKEGSATTGTPSTKFFIANGLAAVSADLSVSGVAMLGSATGAPNTARLNVNFNSGAAGASASDAIDVYDQQNSKVNFRVKGSGFVYARELNVQLLNFPDYVFNRNYKLKSLESLESYIMQNKHLPNVPTAIEIEKNGANLGELNKIQMEKIEELTLYIIELNKKVEALQQQVNNK